MSETVLFIVNPISGKRSKKDIPGLIKECFSGSDFPFEIVYTQFGGDATGIAKRYLEKGFKKIVAVGGDGTVNEVASAITNTDAALGIIPLGSGNGLARFLKIPMDIKKAIELIKHGNKKQIDYGEINQQKFFCTAGVGFDAHIGDVFSKMEGRGFWNYIKATLSEFRKYKAKKYNIQLNDKTISWEAFVITAANASQYGNNAHIAPLADIQDGKLEIVIMRSFPLIAALEIGIRLFLKNIHKSKYVETFHANKIIIKRESPDVVHFDGEPVEMEEMLEIKVFPKGLNVIVS